MAVLRNLAFPLTWVTDHLAVGPAPMSYLALDSLREQGVRAILNLCAEFTDLHDIEAASGFEVYHLPIPDEEAPDLAELEKALAWLDEAIYLGKKVLIHCRHGIGRTGTVLNAYLLRRGLGHLWPGASCADCAPSRPTSGNGGRCAGTAARQDGSSYASPAWSIAFWWTWSRSSRTTRR